jgi:hypothetical protein
MPSFASMLMRDSMLMPDCAAALHAFHHTAGSNALTAKSSRRLPRYPKRCEHATPAGRT